jgi:hypothetical protein
MLNKPHANLVRRTLFALLHMRHCLTIAALVAAAAAAAAVVGFVDVYRF